MNPATLRLIGQILGHLLFWGWNLLFLAVIYFGMGPIILIDLFHACWIGLIPLSFGLSSALLLLLPVLSVGIGLAIPTLRRDPGRLLTLFYGVQAPLMLLAFLRLFAFQELTLATGMTVSVFAVGALALARTVLAGPTMRSTAGQTALLTTQSLYAIGGLWLSASLALLVFPTTSFMVSGLWEALTSPYTFRFMGVLEALYFMLLMAFWLLTLFVWMLFPIALIGFSLRGWQLVHRATRDRSGPTTAWLITAASAAALMTAWAMSAHQPQEDAFALLDAEPDHSPETLLDNQETIRAGLVEAYLWQHRYLTTTRLYDDLSDMWDEAFFEGAGWVPQVVARPLLSPYLYRAIEQDDGRRGWIADASTAQQRYLAFFDEPLTRAEQERIVAARRSTWSWEDAAAGVLDAGEERVWLSEQALTVDEHGDHATITVHDVYRNKTFDDREVVIYFSLPETAALTGLWLGGSADRSTAFTHRVAPRGAAQQVYREQVRRARDPALLEQVGPRQYRLRAFPVLPREGDVDDLGSYDTLGPEMHLWMEIQVLTGPDGDWPMPDVAEVRNLYWNHDTERTLNGEPLDVDGWTPDHLSRQRAQAASAHTVTLDGWTVQLAPENGAPTPRVPEGTIVVIDTSYSMRAHRDALAEAVTPLSGATLLCAAPEALVPCPAFDARSHRFFGSVTIGGMLAELATLPGNTPGVLVLTDRGTYDLETGTSAMPETATPPLWMVHLDGLPLAYTDNVLDALMQSGGGSVTSVEDALQRMRGDAPMAGWRLQATVAADAVADTQHSLHALAARAAITHQAGWSDPAALDDLDALHDLAKRHDVVSPYSSMIVLVNTQQLDRLNALEQGDDRFKREDETAANESAMGLDLGMAPEPHEWVLWLMAAAMLAIAARRRGLSLRPR